MCLGIKTLHSTTYSKMQKVYSVVKHAMASTLGGGVCLMVEIEIPCKYSRTHSNSQRAEKFVRIT